MRSTFASLETARRALSAQQAAIRTTGHNISNANTDGYSRQRVNMEATRAYPTPGMSQSMSAGQLGTGVEAGSVQRIREYFVDSQVREQTTKAGYYNAKSEALSKMEQIMNEPTEEGMSKVIDDFWSSLQDLAQNPANSGARSVVLEKGKAVANTFNYMSSSLEQVQTDLKQEMDVTVNSVNSLATQINDINKQIAQVEPHGLVANDLYDKRDGLVDKLSELTNVKVERIESGGQASSAAAGKYTVNLIDEGGTEHTLVDGENLTANQLKISYGESGESPQLSISGESDQQGLSLGEGGGKLQGLITSYDTDYKSMLGRLDHLAEGLASEFNAVHREGVDLNGESGNNFFISVPEDSGDGHYAQQMKVKDNLGVKDIAAAADEENVDGNSDTVQGDNANAYNLADVLTTKMDINDEAGQDQTVKEYYQSMIGDMGVKAQSANRMKENTATLKSQAEQRRMSISGVSVDEEMTNLIKYQHAYSAAARMVTTVNQMLDTVVNRMGRG
ncbi:flagellar hook-associated protein FlgK [Tuberibacillus sp. Marseille-P3662]|uniref:flagellar hook-associated protein FlgK n=1 Tax=Tuberibacillus sp. Marseille-P3662 TaxID=1965358 RepID=UPI000A1CEAFF|nr:flagellar hook-associated protein FlgK [Tuberibacillus sp. Marseille-P3662]